MKCSRSEFLTAIEGWHDSSCAVHLHTDEIRGAFVVTFCSASEQGVLEFSAHPLLQPLTVDLSNANEFDFVLPEREIKGADSELVKQVADEIALARVGGKLVFSMTRLVDPFAGRLVHVSSRPSPKSDAATAEPPSPNWRNSAPWKALDLTECNSPTLQSAPDSCSAGRAIGC
jgi:hypothetical protein